MSEASFGLGALLGLFGVVASGAVVPVVPTGAAVSVAAALAEQDDILLILLVVAFGAAGAYVSDVATYAALRWAGREAAKGTGRLARWISRKSQGKAVEQVHRQLQEHQLRTLLLSRLVPGGQLPVLLAAAISDYPWKRYATADLAAAALWATVYTAIGLAGRAVFPRPWEGAATGVALVLAISAGTSLWSRRRSSLS